MTVQFSQAPQLVLMSPSREALHGLRKDSVVITGVGSAKESQLPMHQNALLLHAPAQPFSVKSDHPVPSAKNANELVVKIKAIGLNPFDWKSATFGWGIPTLPYVSGRDFSGIVVKAPRNQGRVKKGDTVSVASTDYRDMRKAAFQEYAIATTHNVCVLPKNVSTSQGASLGVAFVAAAIALGVCLGIDFSTIKSNCSGPDLWQLVRDIGAEGLPPDVAAECLESINHNERPKPGDWIAIWGGSSTSALFASQLAQQAGLRVILVVDMAKHGAKLTQRSGVVLVDCHDPCRAVTLIRALTGHRLRYALDTVGKETATHLARALDPDPVDLADPGTYVRAHLVALSGTPKSPTESTVCHSVPVKVFHEVPSIGRALMSWLESLLHAQALILPEVVLAEGGLAGIDAALNRMRLGEISGRRLVVPL